VQSSVFYANNRVITHLGYSPFEIRFGYKLASLINIFKPLVYRLKVQNYLNLVNILLVLTNKVIA
jgi:hypothetical protein